MRQDDPIAPFLFVIVMEALSMLFKNALDSGSVKGVELDKEGLVISHLLYANDCVIMGEWEERNLKNVAKLLRVFNLCSGLRIHLGKSNLYGIEVNNIEVEEMAKLVNCSAGTLPFMHLGANMNRIANWRFLYNIFESRLSNWKATSLSMAGRVTIIKSVMECLPTYFFSLFKAPTSVIDGLEILIRKFLWGHSDSGSKVHWVSWERVASPRKVGGLGICRLKDINVVFLSKWFWRFKTEPDCLWRRIIIAVHDTKRG